MRSVRWWMVCVVLACAVLLALPARTPRAQARVLDDPVGSGGPDPILGIPCHEVFVEVDLTGVSGGFFHVDVTVEGTDPTTGEPVLGGESFVFDPTAVQPRTAHMSYPLGWGLKDVTLFGDGLPPGGIGVPLDGSHRSFKIGGVCFTAYRTADLNGCPRIVVHSVPCPCPMDVRTNFSFDGDPCSNLDGPNYSVPFFSVYWKDPSGKVHLGGDNPWDPGLHDRQIDGVSPSHYSAGPDVYDGTIDHVRVYGSHVGSNGTTLLYDYDIPADGQPHCIDMKNGCCFTITVTATPDPNDPERSCVKIVISSRKPCPC